jgi:hypothetical protein
VAKNRQKSLSFLSTIRRFIEIFFFIIFLQVTCWILLIGLNCYIRLSITSIIRFRGGKSLVLLGSIGQVNSFVGAVLAFVIVNMTNLFKSIDKETCSINNIQN